MMFSLPTFAVSLEVKALLAIIFVLSCIFGGFILGEDHANSNCSKKTESLQTAVASFKALGEVADRQLADFEAKQTVLAREIKDHVTSLHAALDAAPMPSILCKPATVRRGALAILPAYSPGLKSPATQPGIDTAGNAPDDHVPEEFVRSCAADALDFMLLQEAWNKSNSVSR